MSSARTRRSLATRARWPRSTSASTSTTAVSPPARRSRSATPRRWPPRCRPSPPKPETQAATTTTTTTAATTTTATTTTRAGHDDAEADDDPDQAEARDQATDDDGGGAEPADTGPPPAPEPPPGLFPFPPELSPALEGGPYVFPIFGKVGYGDTYGEFRSDVSYHHGDDIFGELGQPIARARRRDDLLARLEQDRRQPALAARPAGQRVLLRAPLGLLDARRSTART